MTEKKKTPTKKLPVNTKKHVIVFDHAKVDTSHCLTDGLFRPLSRVPSKEALDVEHSYKGYTLRWLNYCKLAISDQSVFLAVLRLASEQARVQRVGNSHESPIMQEVRTALKMEKDAAKNDCIVLDTSLYEIAKIIGLTDGGANLQMIKRSLVKLSCVSLIIYKGNDIADAFFKTNLFSRLAGVDGKIHIGINPMLGKALTGGQFTHIDMEEQRNLSSDVSKRMHVWLSSWMREGTKKKIELEKLIPHVWGDMPEQSVLRKRRLALRKAIAEINELESWNIQETDSTILFERK